MRFWETLLMGLHFSSLPTLTAGTEGVSCVCESQNQLLIQSYVVSSTPTTPVHL